MCFVLDEINKKERLAKNTQLDWQKYFKVKVSDIVPINDVVYPFWEDKNQIKTEEIYRGVITDINADDVTVCIENLDEDQEECHVLNRKIFDFNISIGDIIELNVEKSPGYSCVKPSKYVKSQYYKNREQEIISEILANGEEDEF